MKLQPGDKIRVERDDGFDTYGHNIYAILGEHVEAEWRGRWFLGCRRSCIRGRVRIPVSDLQDRLIFTNHSLSRRSNVDCMFEQLIAEGAI